MVFAYAALSAAQKPRQPSGPGLFHFLTGTFSGSIRRIAPLFPLVAGPPGGGFPRRGRALGDTGGPQRPSPLTGEKQKGTGLSWGYGWLGSSHICPLI
jgi:hypothetical protein